MASLLCYFHVNNLFYLLSSSKPIIQTFNRWPNKEFWEKLNSIN